MILCNCEWMSKYSHWLVRLSLAASFLVHGLAKFPGAEAMATALGMPVFIIYLVGVLEVGGAIALLWGGTGNSAQHRMATRWTSAIFAVLMIGAIAMVHFENGWSFANGFGPEQNGLGGMEFQALILAISLHMYSHAGLCCKETHNCCQ